MFLHLKRFSLLNKSEWLIESMCKQHQFQVLFRSHLWLISTSDNLDMPLLLAASDFFPILCKGIMKDSFHLREKSKFSKISWKVYAVVCTEPWHSILAHSLELYRDMANKEDSIINNFQREREKKEKKLVEI